jgi:hypothetical protein
LLSTTASLRITEFARPVKNFLFKQGQDVPSGRMEKNSPFWQGPQNGSPVKGHYQIFQELFLTKEKKYLKFSLSRLV